MIKEQFHVIAHCSKTLRRTALACADTAQGHAVQDLTDIYYFVQVVELGSFTAASKALGVAKSQLSFRVARLEGSLGVRLIQRTTRRSHVSEIERR